MTGEALAQLAKNPIVSKSRKVLLALASHPRTPRHHSIPILRGMFTLDLMNLALTPAVAPDVKRAAEEQLMLRLESLPVGQKITLAEQGVRTGCARPCYRTPDSRIISPALDNKQLTEALVVQALMKPRAPERLYVLIADHSNWQNRREVQIAHCCVVRNRPLDRRAGNSKEFLADFLKDVLPESRQSVSVRRRLGFGSIHRLEHLSAIVDVGLQVMQSPRCRDP